MNLELPVIFFFFLKETVFQTMEKQDAQSVCNSHGKRLRNEENVLTQKCVWERKRIRRQSS